ncbi:MAG: flavoprotein [Actinomycetota bacterium]
METQTGGLHLLVGSCGSMAVLSLQTYLVHFSKVAESTRVIMTRAAETFLVAGAIEALSGNPVYRDGWHGGLRVPHLNLPEWADLFLVLPATANILAKAAHGIADDLLSSTILAAEPPVFFVPAMNPDMWQRRPVQRNVRMLEEDGHHVITSPQLQIGFEAATGTWVESDLMPTPGEVLDAVSNLLPSDT